MLIYEHGFVEKTEYVYAVARVRVLETKLIDPAGYSALLTSPQERLASAFAEVTGIRAQEQAGVKSLLAGLEEAFTKTLYLVKSLIVEDAVKRLVSLKYDYELLKSLIKEERGYAASVQTAVSLRSNYSYPVLKSLLAAGKTQETGEFILSAYRTHRSLKDISGRAIDIACDRAYYSELFSILNGYRNEYIRHYFIHEVDARNIITALRMKLGGDKRAALKESFIPFGSIEAGTIEQVYDLTIEGFSARIILSPLSSVMKQALRPADEGEQIALFERLFDEYLLKYLKESILVTFGVEPLLAYLLTKENEERNLRIIVLARNAGAPPDEIKRHLRGANV